MADRTACCFKGCCHAPARSKPQARLGGHLTQPGRTGCCSTADTESLPAAIAPTPSHSVRSQRVQSQSGTQLAGTSTLQRLGWSGPACCRPHTHLPCQTQAWLVSHGSSQAVCGQHVTPAAPSAVHDQPGVGQDGCWLRCCAANQAVRIRASAWALLLHHAPTPCEAHLPAFRGKGCQITTS